jgi:hypothetical protein
MPTVYCCHDKQLHLNKFNYLLSTELQVKLRFFFDSYREVDVNLHEYLNPALFKGKLPNLTPGPSNSGEGPNINH